MVEAILGASAFLAALLVAYLIDRWNNARLWRRARRSQEEYLERDKAFVKAKLSPSHGLPVSWEEFRWVMAREHGERSVARAHQGPLGTRANGTHQVASRGRLDGSAEGYIAIWDSERGCWIRHSFKDKHHVVPKQSLGGQDEVAF